MLQGFVQRCSINVEALSLENPPESALGPRDFTQPLLPLVVNHPSLPESKGVAGNGTSSPKTRTVLGKLE